MSTQEETKDLGFDDTTEMNVPEEPDNEFYDYVPEEPKEQVQGGCVGCTELPGLNIHLSDKAMLGFDSRSKKCYVRWAWRIHVDRYVSIPDGPVGRRKSYAIRVDEQTYDATTSELEDGSIWSRFTNVFNTFGRDKQNTLANIVEAIAVKSGKPTRGYAKVGWNKDETGKYVFVIEDGRDIYGRQNYVIDTLESMKENGHIRMPDLPLPDIGIKEARELIKWIKEASPNGHQLVCLASVFRSYLDAIVPANTSTFVYGNSGSGKTTIGLTGFNLSFPTYYKDRAHGSFQSTSGFIESKIARQSSYNCLIDDLNVPPTATEKSVQDVVQKLEMIVRTVYNATEARGRLDRKMNKAKSNMFDFMPIITGEILPQVLQSLERRMISIRIADGDVNLSKYKNDMYQDKVSSKWNSGIAFNLLRLGHMSLRTLQSLLNEDFTSVRYELECQEKDYEKQLRNGLLSLIDRELSQLSEYLPQIYARLMTGMYALGRYAYDKNTGAAWSNDLKPFIIKFMAYQVNKMDGHKQECSISSLTEIYKNRVATNSRIAGEYHIFASKVKGKSISDLISSYGDISCEDSEDCEIGNEFWGNYTQPDTQRTISAYIGEVKGTLVYYPQQQYYEALLDIAKHTPGYERFRTKQDIVDAYIKDGWVNRTDKGGENSRPQNEVLTRMPKSPTLRYLELLLHRYIDNSAVTAVTAVTNITDPLVERIQTVTAKESKQYQAVTHSSRSTSDLTAYDTAVTAVTAQNTSDEMSHTDELKVLGAGAVRRNACTTQLRDKIMSMSDRARKVVWQASYKVGTPEFELQRCISDMDIEGLITIR